MQASPYSNVVVSGELVFVSGQVLFDEGGALVGNGDFEAQARRVFVNLLACLRAVGCTFADVVKVNAYLADLNDFPAYNRVYLEHLEPPYPARTTVQVGLLGCKIEVEALARRPGPREGTQ